MGFIWTKWLVEILKYILNNYWLQIYIYISKWLVESVDITWCQKNMSLQIAHSSSILGDCMWLPVSVGRECFRNKWVPHRLFGFSTMTISWEILVSQNALHLGQRWEMRVAIQFYKISHDVQVLAPQLAHWFCMKLARGATWKPSAWSGMEWRWRPCNSCTINHLKSQVKYFLSSLHFFVWIILNRFLEKQFFRRFARASL